MNAVDAILGVPFIWHGRDPALGLDCHGVVLWLSRSWGLQGLELDQIVANAARIAERDVRAVRGDDLALPDGWSIVELGAVQRGDWIWMRASEESTFVEHLEIVEQPGLSVTALRDGGVCRMRWDFAWRRRVHEIWRPPCCA